MNDTITYIDPVVYLMDEAKKLLDYHKPGFTDLPKREKYIVLEKYKELSLTRHLTKEGHFLWTLDLLGGQLSIPPPLNQPTGAVFYNPIGCCLSCCSR